MWFCGFCLPSKKIESRFCKSAWMLNMIVAVITMVVGTPRTDLEKKIEELDIRGITEAIKNRAQLKSAKIPDETLAKNNH